jgi:hypothetical protein
MAAVPEVSRPRAPAQTPQQAPALSQVEQIARRVAV